MLISLMIQACYTSELLITTVWTSVPSSLLYIVEQVNNSLKRPFWLFRPRWNLLSLEPHNRLESYLRNQCRFPL